MKLKPEHVKLIPDRRLYKLNVPVIGLTGGIATGKSTVCKFLAKAGMAIVDADKLVKSVYDSQEAQDFVRTHFPDAYENSAIDFVKLRKFVFGDHKSKMKVEAFIYPKLEAAFRETMKQHQSAKFIVYDIPLLFERNMALYFDLKVLVYAPKSVQKNRLLQRDGQMESMADDILNQQMDIDTKKSLSDVVIDNSRTEAELESELTKFIQKYFIA